MNTTDMTRYDQTELEWMQCAASKVFTERELHGLNIHQPQIMQSTIEYLAITLATFVMKKVEATQRVAVSFLFPANPWEHLKKCYAPRWFLNRWPVKESTHTGWYTAEHSTIFPNISEEFASSVRGCLGRPVFIVKSDPNYE